MINEKQNKTHRETQREEGKRDNSELYYSRVEILGSSLFLQSVLAKLQRERERIRNSELNYSRIEILL